MCTELRKLALCALLCAMADAQAASSADLDRLLQQVSANVAAQCKQYRDVAASAARPFAVENARQGIEVACNCVPKEMARLAGSPRSEGSPEAQAESIGREAFELCGARSFRTRIVTDCKADTKAFPQAEKREKYCQCIETRVGQLSDRQIADDSVRAFQQYEAAVAARAKGEAPPPKEASLISGIEEACRAQVR